MAMITVEGAKLLAQFIPVLILILAVERRLLGPEPEPVSVIAQIWYWAKGVGQSLGAAGALVSMAPLIIGVNDNRSIEGFWTVVIVVSLFLTGQAVIGIVVILVFRGYFGNTRMDRGEERIRLKAEDARDTRRARRARKLARQRIKAKRRGSNPPPLPARPRSS